MTKRKLDANLDPRPTLIYARAPGRINLIGEHTDYNNGLVLPAAIDKYLYLALAPNGTSDFNVTAIDLNQTVGFHLEDSGKTNHQWLDFLKGILLELKNIKNDLSGFDCAFTSEIPMGAGLSSSSALEVAFLKAINELYQLNLDNWALINLSKTSNHNFLGIKGGIMDQFASLFGKENRLMFLDCDSLQHNYLSLPESEYSWLLINSSVRHNHLESGYNDRVEECRHGLADIRTTYPEMTSLSSIKTMGQLSDIEFSSSTIENRVRYVVEENMRVRSFVKKINQADFVACGQLLYASHLGLAKLYEVSCAELDFLVDVLRGDESVLGSRMMGGGFGGCTINLVHSDAIDKIKTIINQAYKNKFNRSAELYQVQVSRGAEAWIVPQT